jgi:SAM-dependent methyltransferase
LETEITDSLASDAKPLSISSDWKFADYTNSTPQRKYMFDFLGPLADKTILDLGCGCHPTPIYFALAGAKQVIANEISPKALHYVSQMAEKFNVQDRVHTKLSPAEKLPFDDGQFDLIHGCAVLHHLDLDMAASEIVRVLKRGGKAVFVDPLGHNRLLEFARDHLPYSWKHPTKGTDCPMKIRDVKRFGKNFDKCQYRGFEFISLAALYLLGRGPSKTKQVVRELDASFLKVFSPLQRYGRVVVTCVQKAK